MSVLRGLCGYWVMLSAAAIEFYAARYASSATPLVPHGALALLALAIVFLPPRAWAWLALPRELARTLAVGIVCAAALLFATQRQLQLLHVLITGGLLALALAGIAALQLLPAAARVLRPAAALLLASLNFLLLAYYAILFIGLEMWHEVVSRELLWTYARQLPELIAALPVSNWIPWTVSATLFALLGAAYWIAMPRIVSGLCSARGRMRRYLAPAGSMHRARLATMIVLLGASAWLADWLLQAVTYGPTPDPLFTTLLADRRLTRAPSVPIQDLALDALDREAAARYVAPAQRARKTLILVIVDALRADQMNVYGHARDNTPFLSRLHGAGRLARFENVFAACTESQCGLLATLGGRYWHELGTARRRFGLPDVLKRLGYRTHFVLSGDHTNFYNLRSFYGDNVDEYIDGTSSREYMNDDRDVIQALARLAPDGAAPRFIYIHLMSAHVLGKRHPQYRIWYKTPAGAAGIKECCSRLVDYTNNYHDGIRQADAMLERIFGILQAKGLLADAVVAITADHGEMLGEDGKVGHGQVPYDPAVRVPLLIYDTDAFGYPPQPLVSVTDIAPTLLDRIGAPLPQHWSGSPLSRPATRRFALTQARSSYAVIGRFGDQLFKYYYFRDTDAEKLVKLAAAGTERAVSSPDEPAAVLRELRGELDLRLPALRRAR